MGNDVVDMEHISDDTKSKLRDFDEQEAYFMLCEIFANAQATKDYARFQSDLENWKKRFPIDLFSEDLKKKIKYMLSKEFLETILKDFIAFDELSKKDPSVGLEKLRKILDRAEKNKDKKQLDKDLDNLYKEYPLKFLKDKYPHLVPMLISKTHIDKILEKFDSADAYKELTKITEHPESFENANEYKTAIEEYEKLYPTCDFNNDYKSLVEKLVAENLEDKKLLELFPISELDLKDGEVISLDEKNNINLFEKNAINEFFNIANKDINNIDGLYAWTSKYSRYINTFTDGSKNAIVNTLSKRYYKELPTTSNFRVHSLNDVEENMSIEESMKNIENMKKDTVLQVLGILSDGNTLTDNDFDQIEVNNKQSKEIQVASVDFELFNFMESKLEDELTFDKETEFYLNPVSTSSSGGSSITIEQSLETPKPETEPETEPEHKQEYGLEREIKPLVKIDAEPKIELEPELELEPEIKSDIESEPVPEAEFDSEVQAIVEEPKLKKEKGFGKFWEFLNRDITPKRPHFEEHKKDFDRDDER